MRRAGLAGLASGAQSGRLQPGAPGWNGGGAAPYSAAQIGLWTFMGVVCSLFLLFSVAYLMRIGYGDWRPAPSVPWQLWLSTGLLGTGSIAWHLAARSAGSGAGSVAAGQSGTAPQAPDVLRWCALAWLSALGFLASQLGGWHALAAQQYVAASSPGAGFFYMLTGVHALHVVGGMCAAGAVTMRLRRHGAARSQAGLALCAQYWHLLLAVWLALFGLLFAVTPELVQAVCASVGIGVPGAR
ncbi:cytochrome c oxidase subunit 3 [Pseudoduganella chitinolytica]|uniref:Cytochrome c oxidase subunit 3 n=1 Tax=Pseudoduganella chitinolytica TaxID=34070 RepID=A0ABY8BD09_9BURK|nr:cytochrome c oxidase subunit 3 [Pseudoduganella chitinolytica]WEF33795.1 cytochrome c oxidase subunit 3 [Pseudoduganella chitinolytica]